MEALYRSVSGAAAGALALLAPIGPLVGSALVCIAIDFVAGVAADRAATRRAGRDWYFESAKARRTVLKLALTCAAILMAWMIDRCILGPEPLRAARMFAGFACGVELWSFLENAAELSEAGSFGWLRRYVRSRIGKEAGDE